MERNHTLFTILGILTITAKMAIGATHAPVLGPYDPSRTLVVKKHRVVRPRVPPKPGCWQYSGLDVVVPLNKTMKRLLVKCFKEDNWSMDIAAAEKLPFGLSIKRETQATASGEYFRYFLVGSTLADSRYAELKFTTPKQPYVFRIQTAQPRNFSDECATADLSPLVQSQAGAPIDYQVALCNADEDKDLKIEVEPALPEGVSVQTRRIRPNRILISLSGSAEVALHGMYKLKIQRSETLLNPITVEMSVEAPIKEAEVEEPAPAESPAAEATAAAAQAPSESPAQEGQPTADAQAAAASAAPAAARAPASQENEMPAIVLQLTGNGEVYVDQQRVSAPYEVELDNSEHSVKVVNSGRVEYARRIPKREDYQGPSLNVWNIVTSGSAASSGYQTGREGLAGRIAELRKRRQLIKNTGRRPASIAVASELQGRMSLREMDMTVEMKLLRQAVAGAKRHKGGG